MVALSATGLGYADIGTALGYSLQTIKNRMLRLRRRYRAATGVQLLAELLCCGAMVLGDLAQSASGPRQHARFWYGYAA